MQFNQLFDFIGTPIGGLTMIILAVWTLYWKGRALWTAAHGNERTWFIALLVINTMGILEILYLFVFHKKDDGEDTRL